MLASLGFQGLDPAPGKEFLTASTCNAVLYISLLFFDFKVCENSVRIEGKLKPVDKTC